MPIEENQVNQVNQGQRVDGQQQKEVDGQQQKEVNGQNGVDNKEIKVTLDTKEFQKVLNDYFYNKKEQEQQQKEKNEEIQGQQKLQMQKIENQEKQLKEIKDILKEFSENTQNKDSFSNNSFSSLLSEVKTLNESVQYSNNQMYFSIVVVGVILISVLMYKFIKIFI